MKKFLVCAVFACLAVINCYSQSNHVTDVLNKVANRLARLSAISYHLEREFSYPSDNYHEVQNADCYFGFKGQTVSRFQYSTNTSETIFNGEELLYLDKKSKTYKLETLKGEEGLATQSTFLLSIATWKNVFEGIISNDSISKTAGDTVINQKRFETIIFSTTKRSIDYLDRGRPFTRKLTLFYTLIVDPETWLPVQVIQKNNIRNNDMVKVSFTNINTKPIAPARDSWTYKSYTDYKPDVAKQQKPLIASGDVIPDWILTKFTDEGSLKVKTSDYRDKLIVMEFWIKNCGYCMEAFKVFKELHARYGQKASFLSINSFDPEKDARFFYKREKPGYEMFYDGRLFAEQLGIFGFPIIIVADKNGKVLYSGVFGEDTKPKIEKLIASTE